jgi:hypothetical protein
MRSTADQDFDLELACVGKKPQMAPAVSDEDDFEELVLWGSAQPNREQI